MREVTDTEQGLPDQVPAFQAQWTKFVSLLRTLTSGLVTDLGACQRDLTSILEGQIGKEERIPGPETPDLAGFRAARAQAAGALLHEPASQWQRKQPGRRALQAIDNYERNLADIVTGLPVAVWTAGPQAVAALEEFTSGSPLRRWAGFRHKPRSLPLRDVLAAEATNPNHLRREMEGLYLAALLRAARSVLRPWDIRRMALDSVAAGEPPERPRTSPQRDESAQPSSLLTECCRKPIEKLSGVPEYFATQAAKRLLKAMLWRFKSKRYVGPDRISAIHAHWQMEVLAVEEEIRLERALEDFEDGLLAFSQETLESLEAEQDSLVAELDRAIGWLRRQLSSRSSGGFPEPACEVVAAPIRMAAAESTIRSQMDALPESAAIISRFSPLPPPPEPPRMLRVRECYSSAFQRTARPLMLQALSLVESEHAKILRGLAQAREVVAFGVQPSGAEEEEGAELAREAIQNALSLLEYYRNERVNLRETAGPIFLRAATGLFVESRLILRRRRLGALVYLAERGLRSASVDLARNSVSAFIEGLGSLFQILNRALSEFLIYIGWKASPRQDKLAVVRRPVMPVEFVTDLSRKELPGLYRRLFRPDPLEDPRFLVGRDREMKAIAEARSFWEAGRPAAVLITGQRGSGKTSLINCALLRCLSGLPIIRGEFSRRVVDEDQLREFLTRFLGIDTHEQIEPTLLRGRSVIILEELERTFLRQVGHFGAIRALLRLIASTCPTTLWILATNQISFQFLSAAVELDHSFSHCINAGGASREDLRNAIMVRHNLSGLRLKYTPVPAPRFRWTIDTVQGRKSPEEIFFDTLAAQCAGVYRSAFDIWLGEIDSIQNGELLMKGLVRPDLSPVVDALSLEDLFTLVAILQHGGLTAEEHSVIFQRGLPSSRSQMDGLLAREIIEAEPARPGFRIRSQAMRVVREALYRRNLL